MKPPLDVPVRTVRRPRFNEPWTAPIYLVPRHIAERIAIEVRSEIDVMASKWKPAPVEVPPSGLCHKPISESFQGHVLEYWCIRAPGHAGNCSPKQGQLTAAPTPDELPLDHADAWGCLDAPLTV